MTSSPRPRPTSQEALLAGTRLPVRGFAVGVSALRHGPVAFRRRFSVQFVVRRAEASGGMSTRAGPPYEDPSAVTAKGGVSTRPDTPAGLHPVDRLRIRGTCTQAPTPVSYTHLRAHE